MIEQTEDPFDLLLDDEVDVEPADDGEIRGPEATPRNPEGIHEESPFHWCDRILRYSQPESNAPARGNRAASAASHDKHTGVSAPSGPPRYVAGTTFRRSGAMIRRE